MSWQVYLHKEYPGDLWKDWDELNVRYHNANPVLSSDFLSLLCHYIKPELFVAVSNNASGIQALILLEKCKLGSWRVFKPSQVTLACILVSPTAELNLTRLFSALPGTANRIDFISLDPAEHASVIASQVAKELTQKATNIRVNVDAGFEHYWESRPKKLKANIKRYYNRLQTEHGEMAFRYITSIKSVQEATDRYGMLESRGWKGLKGTALHPSNYQGQFYREFLSSQANKSSALVIEMYVKEKLIASRLCCFNNGLLIALKTAFDEDFKRYAVGRLLLKELIQWSFNNPEVKLIDFYTNATSEQLEWSTEQRPMFDSSQYAPNFTGQLLSLLFNFKRKVELHSSEPSDE